MKKLIIVLLSFFILNTAYADTCAILMKEVDEILDESKNLSKDQINEIRNTRIQAEEAHKAGDHKESEKLLKELLEKLG
jgi:low affinity Fe/Cu permease